MADDIDIANEMMQNEVARALSRMQTQVATGSKGAKFCAECEDSIPVGRQKLGFKLCVPCAEASERKKSLFAE